MDFKHNHIESFPSQLNIGSGKDFRADFLNLDSSEYWNPDIVYDLNHPFPEGGFRFHTRRFGEILISENTFDKIIANDILEHISNLTVAMKTCLDILKEQGIIEILVPYDLSHGAWQDPTHVRAFNERSWLYYTEWFWYLGWTQFRFEINTLRFNLSSLGEKLQSEVKESEEIIRTPRAVDSMFVRLKKVRLNEKDIEKLNRIGKSPALDSGNVKTDISFNQTLKYPCPLGTEFCIWIVSPYNYPHSRAFDEIALGLQSAFSELGFNAPIVRDNKEIRSTAIVLGCNLIPLIKPVPDLPKNIILFNLEQVQPGSPWMNEAYLNLLKSYPVWDYSCKNIEALKNIGIKNIRYCGIGYAPELTKISQQQEDIDILFYGSINERRKKILEELSRLGIKVKHLFGVYGNARDEYIARAKIILNIHFYEARLFEVIRISYLLANKKFVISEAGQDDDIEKCFAAGLVLCSYEALIDNCVKYLNDDMARKQIAENGFALIKEKPQSAYLKDCLYG